MALSNVNALKKVVEIAFQVRTRVGAVHALHARLHNRRRDRILAEGDSGVGSIGARQEASVSIPITVDKPGLKIVTADVAFGPWDLREWTEAMVTVK